MSTHTRAARMCTPVPLNKKTFRVELLLSLHRHTAAHASIRSRHLASAPRPSQRREHIPNMARAQPDRKPVNAAAYTWMALRRACRAVTRWPPPPPPACRVRGAARSVDVRGNPTGAELAALERPQRKRAARARRPAAPLMSDQVKPDRVPKGLLARAPPQHVPASTPARGMAHVA